ncbi:unnamed protein product [Periconia digitata]|uniref:Uncharacterized protein n=1 Tax=Periconia digitata TaxID=1303443 RepID=A0A9W4UJR1_9PLEO|nr:unnamed protein product [Periconia digitata]
MPTSIFLVVYYSSLSSTFPPYSLADVVRQGRASTYIKNTERFIYATTTAQDPTSKEISYEIMIEFAKGPHPEGKILGAYPSQEDAKNVLQDIKQDFIGSEKGIVAGSDIQTNEASNTTDTLTMADADDSDEDSDETYNHGADRVFAIMDLEITMNDGKVHGSVKEERSLQYE